VHCLIYQWVQLTTHEYLCKMQWLLIHILDTLCFCVGSSSRKHIWWWRDISLCFLYNCSVFEFVFISFSLFGFVLNAPVFNQQSISTVRNKGVYATIWHRYNMCNSWRKPGDSLCVVILWTLGLSTYTGSAWTGQMKGKQHLQQHFLVYSPGGSMSEVGPHVLKFCT